MVFAKFTAPRGGTAQQNIYTASADGSGLQRVTHDTSMDFHDGSPDWRPHPLTT